MKTGQRYRNVGDFCADSIEQCNSKRFLRYRQAKLNLGSDNSFGVIISIYVQPGCKDDLYTPENHVNRDYRSGSLLSRALYQV